MHSCMLYTYTSHSLSLSMCVYIYIYMIIMYIMLYAHVCLHMHTYVLAAPRNYFVRTRCVRANYEMQEHVRVAEVLLQFFSGRPAVCQYPCLWMASNHASIRYVRATNEKIPKLCPDSGVRLVVFCILSEILPFTWWSVPWLESQHEFATPGWQDPSWGSGQTTGKTSSHRHWTAKFRNNRHTNMAKWPCAHACLLIRNTVLGAAWLSGAFAVCLVLQDQSYATLREWPWPWEQRHSSPRALRCKSTRASTLNP